MTVQSRLDILYPDGRSENYRLDQDDITIGSAAGNSIHVSDASLAARHLRFSRRNDSVYLTSLHPRHSTTLDGERAPFNEPQLLRDVCQIRAGQLRIDFTQSSEEPTVAMASISEATQPTAARFRAELETGKVKVWPFSSASMGLSVTNLSDSDGQFRLETSGLPSEWTIPNSLTFSVASNDAVDLLLQVKPAQGHDCAPGEYPLVITLHQLDGGGESVQLVLLIELGGVGGLSAAVEPTRLKSREPLDMVLLNLGNEDLALEFGFRDPQQRLRVTLAQDAARLTAGERAIIGGIAEPRRRPLLSKPRDYSFALLAQARAPGDYTVALPATITVNPIFDYRALVAAAISIVILALALAVLLYQPPQPNITTFTMSEETVARGEPVELSWSAAQALRFVIEVNRAPVAELPAEAASYTLSTQRYLDPIDIALIAIHGDATATESRRLNVYQPVIVQRFSAAKSSLLRDIKNDLTINWRVEGAVALDIALPASFETIQRQVAGDEGEIVIAGAPADDFEIILTAEDEIGGKTTRAIFVAVREPECTPIRDTQLYAGPDARFERVNYAVQNVPVLALGVTAAADWLHVELANGDQGWGFHTNFRCHGFNPEKLKVVSHIPQLPTLTPAPSPTQTSTAASPAPESTAPPATIDSDS